MTTEEKAKAYDMALEAARKELGADRKEWDVVQRVLHNIFPVLAESEDERMRKAALEGIEYLERDCGWDVIGDIDILDVKEYLEKQKELFTNEEMLKTIWVEYEKGVADTIAKYEQKEQPAQSFNQEQFFAKKDSTPFEKELFLSLRAIKETKPSDEEIWFNVKEQLTPVLLGLVQKEQKPAGCADDVVSEAEEYTSKVSCGEYGVEVTEAYIAGVLSERNRDTEWSEFDKGVLKDAICATDTLGNDESFNKSNPNLAKAFRVAKDWLKSLPERFNLKSKQEWSEEDNEVLQQVIADIEDLIAAETSPGFLAKYNKHLKWLKFLPERFYLTPKQEWGEVELEFRGEKVKVKRPFFRDDKGHEYSTAEQDEDVAWYAFRAWCEKKGVSLYDLYPREEWSEEDEKILNELLDYFNTENATWYNWLKSLRPQPKVELTLLDENIIEAAVAFVEQNNHFNCWRGVDKHTVIKALRSLKPHWKPSEEQMRSLEYFIKLWGDSDDQLEYIKVFNDVKTLYNDLKSL